MKLIFIVGPPAVGKMTVGQQLAEKLDYKLFHNHHSIETALSLFYYGSDEFNAVNQGIRNLVFKTAAQSKQLKGLIFTLVWAFDLQEDWDYVENIKSFFQPHGWEFYFLELYAPLEVRIRRNATPNRLEHKASKRDLKASAQGIREMEEKYQLNTDDRGINEPNYIKLDNTLLTADVVAEMVIREFSLEKR